MTIRDVLGAGFVRLVDHMGDDASIVRAARVSYNADWRGGDDEKLIKYLMDNNHTSPFEAVQFTFEVKAPIFIFRQWHRHRTWSYNEISARYTQLDEGFYVPQVHDVGVQSKENKQGRYLEANPHAVEIADIIAEASKQSYKLYEKLLALECPREVARMVLPVNAYSRMFASVDLHNLFHFLKLRMDTHSQFEIRQYAWAMADLAEGVVPIAMAAFRRKHGL